MPTAILPKFERPKGMPFRCSDQALVEAVHAWLMGCEDEEVARILKVPVRSYRVWISTESWEYLVGCLSDPVRKLVHGQMTRQTNLALKKVEERLTKGEPVYSESGQISFYREIRVKDLATLTATLVDKQIEIEKRLLGERDPQVPIELNTLWEGLKKLAEKQVIEGSVIGEYGGPTT